MAKAIKLPRMTDTMEEGVVASWLVKVGDEINPGDMVAEVETDKATMELENFEKGESIGYGRKNKTKTDRKIAVIPIGYADGYSRKFSQGKGFFIIQNKHAPVVGNVCMDMTMCDVSEIDCKEGERIFVYKSAKHFYELSKNIDTIPYELISTISQRVPRKFTYE